MLIFTLLNGREMDKSTLLDLPVGELGLSPEFCGRSKIMGYGTIREMVAATPEQMIGKKGFTYTWLGELTAFLTRQQLLHLLQPIPGKSYG